MELSHGIHLAYCTNIHRGETWAETLQALERHTLEVKQRVARSEPYAIGLRLGAEAVRSLLDPATRMHFQRWLERNGCYVFTINGFPYGQFHGTRVKEQVYRPEWHKVDRLDYTKALFTVLSDILLPGIPGSVSTLPGAFKAFNVTPDEEKKMISQLQECAGFIARLADQKGQDLHLGLEPEPLCYVETSTETIDFLAKLGSGEDLKRCVGVNYDTCHLAIEYEDPATAWANFRSAGVRISKLHLSSALKLTPSDEALRHLRDFQEDTYLHQTIIRDEEGKLTRYQDLPDALAATAKNPRLLGEEWRVHFHVPLHALPEMNFGDTKDHLCGVLDALAAEPEACQHLEMETYTWGVLPQELRTANVADQLEKEYAWTLNELGNRGLASR